LRERIYALGEAHDFVRPQPTARDDAEPPTLFNLIRRLLRPYDNGESGTISFSGEDAPIEEGAITPIALLVHELATNSAKYGALSADTGSVAIAGRFDADNYVFEWVEAGGPAVVTDADRREGFGSRLMSLSVEGQMRGKLERTWREGGLAITA